MMRRILLVLIAALAAAGIATAESAFAESASASIAAAQGAAAPREAVIEKLRDNLYVVTTGGPTRTNITFFITEHHGVVMFETGDPGWGVAWLDALRKITSKPLTTVVISHTHDDHTGSLPEIGHPLVRVAHANVKKSLAESTCAELSGCRLFKGANAKYLPTRTYTGKTTLFEGADRIELYTFGASHTNGDTIAVIPSLGVIVMGDMMAWRGVPRVYVDDGGRAINFPSALAAITAIKNVDTVITGHTLIMTWADLLEFRDYVTEFASYVTEMHKAGKTVNEAMAGLPQRLAKYRPCAPTLTDAAELEPNPNCRYRTDQAARNATIMYDELEGRVSTFGSERPRVPSARGARAAAPEVKAAPKTEIVFMSTDAIIDPLQAIHAETERAVGRTVKMHWGSARGDLKEAILADAPFDVALLIPQVNADLLKAGKVLPENYEIAQVKTAIGQRGTGPLVDVSTPEALKRAILGARALRWFQTGIALATVDKVLDTLDVRAAATAKLRPQSDLPLGPGEYELNFYPLSEILTRRDLRNLGVVIDDFQVPGVLSAVIGARAKDPSAARALIEFLRGPAIEAALAKSGFTRRAG